MCCGVLGLLVGLSATALSARAQAPSGLDALLARFAAVPGLEAHFREEKRIGLLAAPLVSEGTLRYAPPGRLVRRTTRPETSTVRVSGDRLQIVDAAGRREVDLASQPVVRSFVDAFLGVLSGDRHTLERNFTVGYTNGSGGAGWQLTLTPRTSTLRRLVTAIVVEGRGVILSRLVVHEADGDSSVTTFDGVDASKHYTPSEVGRLFRLAGS